MVAGNFFRTPVCEAPLPSEDLPVPTLQLRRICAARTQRGRRTCSCHQSLGPAIRDMLLPFKYRLQLKCCLNTRAAPHAGPDFHLRSEEALLPAQVRRAGRPPGARECCTQKDKLGGGRSRCVRALCSFFLWLWYRRLSPRNRRCRVLASRCTPLESLRRRTLLCKHWAMMMVAT